MAYGNNRSGEQPRSHFRLAGGSIIKFRHPYFAGQIETGDNTAIDEIDISACCKLEGRFFEANQNQDSARQVVLIDGSTVTISNKMLNGTITIPAVKTTGLVGTGDFIAGCQLIQSIGDSVGGILTKTDYVNGNAITRVYYGVTVQRCPTDVSEGNDVAVYNVTLLYSGWIEAMSTSADDNKTNIWAVGNKEGISAFYAPYGLQNQHGNGGSKSDPIQSTAITPAGSQDIGDSSANNVDNSQEVTAVQNTETWGGVLTGVETRTFSATAEDKAPETTTPNP